MKWRAIYVRRYREENAGVQVNFAEVYRAQGQTWRDLPDDQRVKYEDLAGPCRF
jgi:hypothetical protein